MSRTLVIASREMAEKKFALMAAAIVSLLPFAAPYLPGIGSWGVAQSRMATAMFFAGGFTLALAVMLGASMIGRDLSERRLSFYFSRPVSPSAIWFGKVSGSIALAALSGLIILTPTFIAAVVMKNQDIPWPLLYGLPAVAIIVVLISHAGSTMIRSRSPLALLDLAMIPALALVGWLSTRLLFDAQAGKILWLEGGMLSGAVLLAFVIGGLHQLRAGRTQIKANHRALSRALWTVIVAAVVLLAGFNLWLTSAKPRHLGNPSSAAIGNYALISGFSFADYRSRFLLNVSNGSWIRLHPASGWTDEVAGSRDGHHAFWFDHADQHDYLVHAVLGASPVINRMSVQVPRYSKLAVDSAGSRVSVSRDELITVFDVSSGRSIGSLHVPARIAEAHFITPSLLRIYGGRHDVGHDERLEIFEWNLDARQMVKTGEVAASDSDVWAAGDGELFVRAETLGIHPFKRCSIVDARTGAELAAFGREVLRIQRLRDKRIVMLVSDGKVFTSKDFKLRIDGLPDIPLKNYSVFVGEMEADKLIVASYDSEATSPERFWTTSIFDTKSGAVIKHLDVRPLNWWRASRESLSMTRSVFQTREGDLVTIDPQTLALKPLT